MGRKQLVHAVRIGMLVCIVVLMRLQQQSLLSTINTSADIAVAELTSLFPAAALSRARDGRVEVLDADGTLLGHVIQTSPECDHIIGFSGPTNVMLGFTTDDVIAGMKIRTSGDTRDHVRKVEEDERFITGFNSLPADEAARLDCDAVSGATLTSLAIREAIACRLGDSTSSTSLRFPDPPTTESVRIFFPACDRIDNVQGTSVFLVYDGKGTELGSILRTSPAADNTIGYQGPTDALIAFDRDHKIAGVALGKSYDNEPYVSYVRDDAYFRSLFNGLELEKLAELDLFEQGVQGVSGATMTSMAVAEGLVLAAKARQAHLEASRRDKDRANFLSAWSIHDFGTALCVVIGSMIGLTRLRGNRILGILWQLVLVLYLGLTAGSLLSQAMLVGWSRNGVPTRSAFGLILLAVAALLIPVATRRNLYCSHLCPHGAAQQLLKHRLPWRVKVSSPLRSLLRGLPAALLLWCVVVGMTTSAFSLVDIEPFDAYVWKIAGWATISIAIIGLVASMFVPMAYCRFGCPTGTLLEFVRFHGKADQWSRRDWVAASSLLVAVGIYLVG